jgi:hypothetical protein
MNNRLARSRFEGVLRQGRLIEALKHVKGGQLTKAIKKAKEQRRKSVMQQGALPTVDKYGNVSKKEWEKHEDRQYRLQRATTEIEGEVAKRLRKQKMRPNSRVAHIEREAAMAGDLIRPRATKTKKKKLKGNR